MSLSAASITRLANGDMQNLPSEVQVLNIHRLNDDVRGVHMACLKLSDGKNYYGGFVIDMSILDSLHVNVYSVVRIDKLLVLNDSPGKQVLQILEMELLSQEKMCIGQPEPCLFQVTQMATSIIVNNHSMNAIVSSTYSPSVYDAHSMCRLQKPSTERNHTFISELTAGHARQTTVEGRVDRKSEICNFSNGNGFFFLFDLVYQLSHFMVNRANKQYNHLSHELEINLIKDAVVHEIHEDAYANVDISFNITKISAISLEHIGKCFG
ncbi:unnamed protein product [Rotaria magnacalcarata]|uniref:Uncharacterized protein n=1 Tax=Rotaria magnacalcarata TaxID=392030 RepID=A0A816MMH8_9BILA|nr:unnamed protein product [Rotaria magnacalcarata]CAF3911828.1 unnamed protein product [Rotaria magnacalcarata]